MSYMDDVFEMDAYMKKAPAFEKKVWKRQREEFMRLKVDSERLHKIVSGMQDVLDGLKGKVEKTRLG